MASEGSVNQGKRRFLLGASIVWGSIGTVAAADLHRRITERSGQMVLERYGMTETVMLVSNPYDGERRAGTVALVADSVDVTKDGDAFKQILDDKIHVIAALGGSSAVSADPHPEIMVPLVGAVQEALAVFRLRQQQANATSVSLDREFAEAEHGARTAVVEALNLEIPPESIDPQAPLYGEGLGLDSIDILEVALVVSQRYGFQLRSDDDELIAASVALAAGLTEAGRMGASRRQRPM